MQRKVLWSSGSQSKASRTTASASAGNSLDMEILRPASNPTESETLAIDILSNSPGDSDPAEISYTIESLWCTVQSPGEIFKILMPRLQLIQVKSESLWMGSMYQYFKKFLRWFQWVLKFENQHSKGEELSTFVFLVTPPGCSSQSYFKLWEDITFYLKIIGLSQEGFFHSSFLSHFIFFLHLI